uniref:glutaminyl-peptide cyclotransferase n=1 Tax=Lepeophtheirus salmonis TaxID=72036 RepID=D3PJ07_LEPSM|nr:Glutaminyl-peptide cyclotransferase [Lepeophtheirus salmonis]
MLKSRSLTAKRPLEKNLLQILLQLMIQQLLGNSFLACHYDSKLTPKGFLGAIDSAVPCAQMMNVAHTLRNVLQNRKAKDISLQLVFFDGEEAFVNWNKKDSIYGARHMAQNWTEQKVVFGNEVGRTLDRIDLFVLLDLLGTKLPNI